ncbi:hypothetical protein A3F00_02360 [Candidatus Daviesbacteria bacterium RIFCSPHIGHO2_12_FULL_37_11]|uniref:Glycosyl transferase family 1 domain-containing protein n=1 Tax=Candidatus Daviesbacteria bacterium RIFCSPHIGHO2_12_FULL_37_11 TaxID=1797777 RepID=A0A1F5K8T6_9BACT|nr:MAG: hypothetical protein A2769_00205 [Candidatus Daviesbacteria bacterium RIFCSPHIGHO2_01_FULL_37_27]OGE37225.1 MAG: hypothetical protein A3F00_02360 [Candidatus Daviesbacteria bacterium RIFCSPHIGHO2_12_FULL_37_11]OGE46098.1 MAG: hypothetical protein A3B39_00815 [Candidatus Daviesbacteria bacterium RIFCSPLOWO2_01_FULL_37_10]
MNILIFSWRDIKHPLAGGAEQVMHEHAKGWIEVGHSVTHFSAHFSGAKIYEEIDGIKLVRFSHQYLGVQIAGFFFYIKNRNKFDVVIDEFHGLPFFTPLYVRKKILAVVQETARGVWFFNSLPTPLNWLVGFIGYIIEPFAFLFYRQVNFMTGSRSAKEDIAKMGVISGNITVIPHGVITPKKNSQHKNNKKNTVMFLGKLSKDKGIEDAIKCFSILNSRENFQFWIIGKPETKNYGDKIKEMVINANLDKKLKFWGFVSQQKKFDLLSMAHILVNPSIREGWGLVNIEANSVGTPVIAYKSAGLIDSVKNGLNGLICNQNSPEELANKVLSLFNNDKLYMKLSTGGKKWSRKFSWKRSCKLSLKLLESI